MREFLSARLREYIDTVKYEFRRRQDVKEKRRDDAAMKQQYSKIIDEMVAQITDKESALIVLQEAAYMCFFGNELEVMIGEEVGERAIQKSAQFGVTNEDINAIADAVRDSTDQR